MGERVLLPAGLPVARPGRPAGWSPVPMVVTGMVAAGLAGLWLAAPPMGTDLSAQVARADFFAGQSWAPVDFRWYGGVLPLGYSLLTPPLMAGFGPRPVGAVAAVVGALALAALLRLTGAPRPLLGGVLGAVGLIGNLVSGRVTFAVGVALGLLALLPVAALIMESSGRVAGGSGRKVHDRPIGRGVRYAGAGMLAGLAAAASPVAGLFVGLAGVAVGLAGVRVGLAGVRVGLAGIRRARPGVGAGAVLAIGAAVPIAGMAGLFGSGGWMNISRSDVVHAAVASLLVAALVPHRVVRIGAVLSAAGVVAAYLVPTPVGLNATRLATMFALPVVAGYAAVPGWLRRAATSWLAGRNWPAGWRESRLAGWRESRLAGWRESRLAGWQAVGWLVPVLVVLAWWQPPVLVQDLASAGDPTAAPGYFRPLRAELAGRAPPGRVEVVPTEHYGESAYLGQVPLARGWLRQIDLSRNRLFFDQSLDAGSYRRWLADQGVSYVALPDAEVSWVGQAEAELIRSGLPYLTPVWETADWTLYRVAGAPALVAGPAVVTDSTPDTVVVEVERPADLLLRVRWSRWLAVSGPGDACLAEAGGWTALRVTEPGGYRVTGSLTGTGPRC
jgi:hypothetical protein